MSKSKGLTSTYINYYAPGKSDPDGIRLVTLNGKDIKVFYKTDYNTYIPHAITYIIGTLGHFGNKRNRPEKHVFISNKKLSAYIGVSYGHASTLMDQLEEIFKLEVEKKRGRNGFRKVKISKTFIDFLKVFNDEDLEDFIIDHDIPDNLRFAVKQIYKFIGWGIAPAQLTPEEKAKRKEYMSDEERRNYWHYAYTSEQDPQTRINEVQQHLDKLSESQRNQFENLKAVHTPGERLNVYWHWILIKLQQIVTWLTSSNNKNNKQEDTNTSVNSENTNKKESVAHKSATMVSQKKPDSDSIFSDRTHETPKLLQFAGQVVVSWNARAERNAIPEVRRVTKERYHSLLTLLEEFTEQEIFEALDKLEYLHTGYEYDHKMQFNRFIQSETILYLLEYDSTSMNAIDRDVMDQITDNFNIKRLINTVPSFESLHDLNTWLHRNYL